MRVRDKVLTGHSTPGPTSAGSAPPATRTRKAERTDLLSHSYVDGVDTTFGEADRIVEGLIDTPKAVEGGRSASAIWSTWAAARAR